MSDDKSDVVIPKGWKSGSLGEFCEMYQPRTISTKELIDDGDYPVYGANGQIGFYNLFNHEDSEVTVTCRGATCGTVNVIPAKSWITGNAMVVRPLDNCMSKELLHYLLNSLDFTNVITGTAQPQITRTTLTKTQIVVPAPKEQKQIVEILEEQLSRLDAALASVRMVHEKAARFRRSLLNAAFTGSLSGNYIDTGELPEGWKRLALGDVLEDAQSGFASGIHNSTGTGVVHMRPMNVSRDGNIDFSETKYVEDKSNRRLRRGDVLFNNTNSSALVGKTAFVDTDEELAFSNHMTRLRPDSSLVVARFLAPQLHALWLNGYFEEICSNHVNQASVSTKRLKEVEVNFPSLEEQESIVEVLEEQLSRLDAALVIGEAIEKKTTALRRSLLHAAFTGELTKEWRGEVHV